MIQAYPLQWPVGYKRTPNNQLKHAQFQTSFADSRNAIIKELKLMGATNPIISSNVPLKKDGLPYAVPFGSKNVTDDTGIAVYFTFKNQQKVICCDAYHTLDDNMQAIRKSIEALRGLDRWKCSDIVNQTFTGFNALPEHAMAKPWWDVLGVMPLDTEEQIKDAYRQKAKTCHPDAGGSAEAFHALSEAYQMALSQIK